MREARITDTHVLAGSVLDSRRLEKKQSRTTGLFFSENPTCYTETKRLIKAASENTEAHYETTSTRLPNVPSFDTTSIYGDWDPSQKRVSTKAEEDESTRREVIYRSAEQLHRHLNIPVLSTEDIAEETIGLAELAQKDETLPRAIQACLATDHRALQRLLPLLQGDSFLQMTRAIQQTLQQGGKIFLSGCGASGRLSILLERICKELFPEFKDQFVSLIAGGDFALVRAIENFEDNRAYALKQLEIQGFNAGCDLLIGNSASGGAPFINQQMSHVGAFVQHAGKAYLKPWLILCNQLAAIPDIHNENVNFLELDVGPNALSGSSRMQSATVTQIAIYWAISKAIAELKRQSHDEISQIKHLLDCLNDSELPVKLTQLICYETDVYCSGNRMVYEVINPESSITIFTDMTERAPTFSQKKPENKNYPDELNTKNAAQITVSIQEAETPQEALKLMLGRDPVCLQMPEEPKTKQEILLGFDFSKYASRTRSTYLNDCEQKPLKIHYEPGLIHFDCDGKQQVTFHCKDLSPFYQKTFLKILLNIHSTLIMGRLEKFYSNTMLGVSLGNAKLFARVVRYIKAELNNRFPGLNKLMRIPGYVSPIEQAIALVVAKNKLHEFELTGSIVKESLNQILSHLGAISASDPDSERDIENLRHKLQAFHDFEPMNEERLMDAGASWTSHSVFKQNIHQHLENSLALKLAFSNT